MKIAIVTLPLHSNYGGILQAYALQTILERMGHKVTVIDRKRKLKSDLNFSVKVKRFILKYFLFRRIQPLYETVKYRRDKITSRNTWKFVDKYIKTRSIHSFYEIKQNDYDAFVVGSDQVWRYHYFVWGFRANISSAFLDFTSDWNVKRVAYAASFGTKEWEYPEIDTNICSVLINKFDAVSVRETDGLQLISRYLGFEKGQLCLDPTLLLSPDDYLCLLGKEKKTHKNRLFFNFLDYSDDKFKLVGIISEEKKLISFEIKNRNNDNDSFPCSPLEDWLSSILDSDFIVTDSFHTCVFSILFKKPFIVIGNRERGISRYQSLLQLLGLEDRLIFKSSEYEINKIYSDVMNVSDKIDKLRETSIYFLKTALN